MRMIVACPHNDRQQLLSGAMRRMTAPGEKHLLSSTPYQLRLVQNE